MLSASGYTGPEKTSSRPASAKGQVSLTLQRTMPTFRLESSRSVSQHHDRDEGRFTVFTDTVANRDEPIDELTASKHVAHIDGNNIEVKAGEYYQ